MVAQTCNSSSLGSLSERTFQGQEFETNSWAQRCEPVVPATLEAELLGTLEPTRRLKEKKKKKNGQVSGNGDQFMFWQVYFKMSLEYFIGNAHPT